MEDLKILCTVFGVIFLAELGDKTQLATMLFAADRDVNKMTVFLGASLALIVASGLGVLAGGLVTRFIDERYLRFLAGSGFVGIGLWTLVKA